MDSLASWIWSLVEPIAKRVAVALGFGYLSFQGAAAALQSAFESIQSAFGGLMSEVAALLAIAGFFDAMAVMSGGILSGLAWMALKRWAVVGAGS